MKRLFKLATRFKYFLAIVVMLIAAIYFMTSLAKPSQAAVDQTITDQNGDGTIDLVDARILAPPATTSCPVCVDVNGDKVIDQKDADLVQNHLTTVSVQSTASAAPRRNSRFDVNNDGVVDNNDVAIVQSYVGQSITGTAFGLDNPSQLTGGFMSNDLLIWFKPETTDTEKQALYTKYNLTEKNSLRRVKASEVSAPDNNVENLQKRLATEAIVKSTTKNLIAQVMTDDPYWTYQWGHQKINIEQTWYTETTGRTSPSPKVKVALIDTGVDYNHFDLGQNLSQSRRYNVEQPSPVYGFNDYDLSDPVGHGTHMAGIIGATVNNGQGIAGVNWNVEIIPVKSCFLNHITGGADCPLLYVYQALDWVSYQNVDIVNMSLGTPDYYSNDNDLGDYYLDLLHNSGVILVAAAGNDGRDQCTYPAAHAGVVCVGATDQNDALAVSSSGRRDATILAPGVAIVSTVPSSVNSSGVATYNGDNTAGGTSMAAAYVSGVAALCKSVASQNTDRAQLKCDNNFKTNGYGRIDAWPTVWYHNCQKMNPSHENAIGILALQNILYRVNQPAFYAPRYDIFPAGGDGKIDIADLYLEAMWYGVSC